jgi:hypothetical protein
MATPTSKTRGRKIRAENNQDTVQTHALHLLRDDLSEGMKQTRRAYSFAQRQTTGCKDDDGPWEVVEVLLGQQADTEE